MKTRVITALALLPPFLIVFFCNLLWPVAVVGYDLFLLGRSELARIFGVEKPTFPFIGTAIFALSLVLLSQPAMDFRFKATVIVSAIASVLGVVACTRLMKGIRPNLWLPIAEGWIAGPLICVIAVQRIGESARPELWRLDNWVLMTTVPIWAGDTFAILVGKYFGRHKLWPELSPKKTWEGTIANALAAIGASLWLGRFLDISFAPALLCGISTGLLGQAGDLFESTIKRVTGVKDSGSLLPGHGGILDRIDSTLGSAPAVAIILTFLR